MSLVCSIFLGGLGDSTLALLPLLNRVRLIPVVNLVRVFYTNLKFEGNNLVSHVKDVEMEITHEVWAAVAGLKFSGLRINKGNLGVVEDFNKIQYYKSCLKNQHAQVRTCSVGGLKLDERLLTLIVTWILTSRGSNHSVLALIITPVDHR